MQMSVLVMSTFVRMEEGVPECRTHKGVTVGRGTSGTGVEQVKTHYTSFVLAVWTHSHVLVWRSFPLMISINTNP